MTLSYGVLSSSAADVQAFKDFHNLLFKNTDASEQWLQWYFRLIPGEHTGHWTRVYTLRDDADLVGSWCVEPKDFMLDDGTIIKVGRCFAVGIHPNYRRRNLFVDLSKFAIDEERKLGKYEYVLGFPQVGRPVIDAHLKSGWERIQIVDMYSSHDVPSPKVSLASVKTVYDFHVLSPRPDYTGSFIESDTYRNNRWDGHPDHLYLRLCFGGGYVILKVYNNACHVLDVRGTPSEVTQLLLAARTLAYRHRWIEVTIWNALNDHLHDAICAAGFVPGATCGTSVELLAVRINAQTPLTLEKCHLQMGNEEIY